MATTRILLLLCAGTATFTDATVVRSLVGLGEQCLFPDGAAGVCEEALQCEREGGVKWRNGTIVTCAAPSTGQLVVCCRRPRQIADKMCTAWSQLWGGEQCCESSTPLIHGGVEAALGEFPHMVSIGYREQDIIMWRCGGSLITPVFVLTAAHCIRDQVEMVVGLGEHDLNSPNKAMVSVLRTPQLQGLAGLQQMMDLQEKKAPVEQVINVGEAFWYPEYQRNYHDIGLLRLETPVALTCHALPACLQTNTAEHYSTLDLFTVAGWGSTRYGEEHQPGKERKLQKVQVPNVHLQECEQGFGDQYKPPLGLTTDIICAGTRGKDSCPGDSGGPLMPESSGSIDSKCKVRVVAGIVSFGPYCGQLGAYTRVSAYLDWIIAHVAPRMLP